MSQKTSRVRISLENQFLRADGRAKLTKEEENEVKGTLENVLRLLETIDEGKVYLVLPNTSGDKKSTALVEDFEDLAAKQGISTRAALEEMAKRYGFTLKPASSKRKASDSEKERKKHRKSYTVAENEAIIRAARLGPQALKLVCKVMEVPESTARCKVKRYLAGEEATHDRRHDPETHKNHFKKLNQKDYDRIEEGYHFMATLTLREMATIINREKLRDIAREHFGGTDDDPMLQEGPLTRPLDSKRYEAIPEIKEAYDKVKVDYQVINRACGNLVLTKKHVVTDRISANTDDAKASRLEFANTLNLYLQNSNLYDVIFVDETPYYIGQKRIHGRAKRGTRAVWKTPPGGPQNNRIQVALAVRALHGVFVECIFAPEKVVKIGKTGRKVSSYKANYTVESYASFVDDICRAILEKWDEFKGKNIVLVYDRDPTHGPKSMKLIEKLESYNELLKRCGTENKQFIQMKMPKVSPQLNLVEYYNRTLRFKMNHELNNFQNQEELLRETMRGTVTQHRIDVIVSNLKRALQEMERMHFFTACYGKMLLFLNQVIQQQGYLDWATPM